jgi:hypothetical protein
VSVRRHSMGCASSMGVMWRAVPEKALNGFEGRIGKPIEQVRGVKDELEDALEVKVPQ